MYRSRIPGIRVFRPWFSDPSHTSCSCRLRVILHTAVVSIRPRLQPVRLNDVGRMPPRHRTRCVGPPQRPRLAPASRPFLTLIRCPAGERCGGGGGGGAGPGVLGRSGRAGAAACARNGASQPLYASTGGATPTLARVPSHGVVTCTRAGYCTSRPVSCACVCDCPSLLSESRRGRSGGPRCRPWRWWGASFCGG